MKYFKMILNDEIIGAISSDNFICYIPGCGFMQTTEEYGEYVDYKHQLYRSTWMTAPTREKEFTEVVIMSIPEDEYKTYVKAFESEQVNVLPIVREPITVVELPPDPNERASVEFLRTAKLKEISNMCHQTIEEGFDFEVKDEIKHFSLDTQDQLNLMMLSEMAQTEDEIPYHADGEECIFYTAEEILDIVSAANAFKIYHTTYHNALKAYVKSLDTTEELVAVEYGMEIPEEYKTEVLKSME